MFDINNRIAAVFIGRMGKNLKRIEEEIGKGTSIIITNNNGNQQRLIVTTDQENIEKAVRIVEKNMSDIAETVRMSEQRQQQRKRTQICRAFLNGTCKRKDPECWFSHDVKVPRRSRSPVGRSSRARDTSKQRKESTSSASRNTPSNSKSTGTSRNSSRTRSTDRDSNKQHHSRTIGNRTRDQPRYDQQR